MPELGLYGSERGEAHKSLPYRDLETRSNIKRSLGRSLNFSPIITNDVEQPNWRACFPVWVSLVISQTRTSSPP